MDENTIRGGGNPIRWVRWLGKYSSVDVWQARLDIPPVEIRLLGRTLSDKERIRSERFILPADRSRYVGGRGLLRQVLGRYLRCAPENVELCCEPGGKPAVCTSSQSDVLHLSISHAADVALFAFSRHSVVGIDVELIRPIPEMCAIVQDCFSAREQVAWDRLPEDQRQEAFFHFWTRKEAVLKAMGTGLAFPPERVEVTCTPNEPARLLGIDDGEKRPREWSLAPLYPSTGYVGALAHLQKPSSGTAG